VKGGSFYHQPAGKNVVSANDIEHLSWKLLKAMTIETAEEIYVIAGVDA
jgi:hypothetical protein